MVHCMTADKLFIAFPGIYYEIIPPAKEVESHNSSVSMTARSHPSDWQVVRAVSHVLLPVPNQ